MPRMRRRDAPARPSIDRSEKPQILRPVARDDVKQDSKLPFPTHKVFNGASQSRRKWSAAGRIRTLKQDYIKDHISWPALEGYCARWRVTT